MPKRAHDHADDRRSPTVSDQLAGTLFDLYPVGSQPRPSSERTADLLAATDELNRRRRFVLQRLDRSPCSADRLAQELHELTGISIAELKDEHSPRFTELCGMQLAVMDETVTWKTAKNRPCHPYQITAMGRKALALVTGAEREAWAKAYIASKQRGPEAAP